MMAKRQGPFPVDQVLAWLDQLLDVLDYLHTQEPPIVHRDIKPQNLKLTSRGQIILLDFGLAKGQVGEMSRVTTSASIFGYTPNYAPLEQIQGLGTDARSDLYSVAATVYHLMTGVKPPDALTRAAAIVNGQLDPLLSASEANPAVSAQVADVLQKAMAQNREQRFRTAAEMRRALEGTSLAATITNRAEAQTVLFPPPASSSADTQIAAVHETVAKLPTVQSNEATVVRPQVRKSSSSRWAVAAGALLVCCIGAAGFYAFQRRQGQVPVGEAPVNSAPLVEPAGSLPVPQPQTSTPEQATGPGELEEKTATASEKKAARVEKTARAIEQEPPTKPKPEPDNTESDRGKVIIPEIPEAPEDLPEDTRRRARRPGGVIIRNLPDGSQVIAAPDGTRVLITPDGRRRFIRRGAKHNRDANPYP
jgi:serine/threonine protein kinase